MRLSITVRELRDLGVWDKFCDIVGLPKDNMMELPYIFHLSDEQLDKLGIFVKPRVKRYEIDDLS